MTRQEQAKALGVSAGTIDNYTRTLRDEGRRVTMATLRAHQRRTTPGRNPDLQRATVIGRMRDRLEMPWAAIGEAWGFSGSRARAIYRIYCR